MNNLEKQEYLCPVLWKDICNKIDHIRHVEPKNSYTDEDFLNMGNKLQTFLDNAKAADINVSDFKKLINNPVLRFYKENYYFPINKDTNKTVIKNRKVIDRNLKKIFEEILPCIALKEYLKFNGKVCSIKHLDKEFDSLIILDQKDIKLEITRAIKGGQEFFWRNNLRQDGVAFNEQKRNYDNKSKKFSYNYESDYQKECYNGLPVPGINSDIEHYPYLLLKALEKKEKKIKTKIHYHVTGLLLVFL